MSSVALVVIGVPVVLLALLFGLFVVVQKWILYMPQAPNIVTVTPPDKNKLDQFRGPKYWGFPYETLKFKAKDDVKLTAWLMKTQVVEEGENAPTIIFCHGNAGNMGFRLPLVYKLCKRLRCNVVIFDYRGYGFSRDYKITEDGLKDDLSAVVEYLVLHANDLKIDIAKIVVMGKSLGGAVAIGALAKYKDISHHVSAVILENTFLSVPDMATSILENLFGELACKVLDPVIQLFLFLRWDSKKAIQKLHQPMLFLSGGLDDVVPSTHMTELYTRLEKHRRIKVGNNTDNIDLKFEYFRYGGHNNLPSESLYFEKIKSFLVDVCKFGFDEEVDSELN